MSYINYAGFYRVCNTGKQLRWISLKKLCRKVRGNSTYLQEVELIVFNKIIKQFYDLYKNKLKYKKWLLFLSRNRFLMFSTSYYSLISYIFPQFIA